ncbi:MAG: hypothetical protein MZV64_50465 [Ignavibacteriales bacterium]|nr:hypothetical protein [Ignavibacteriales bacterium]
MATPMITPVRMPGIADGRTTFLMVCHLVAPRAMLPSRKELGTLLQGLLAGQNYGGYIYQTQDYGAG